MKFLRVLFLILLISTVVACQGAEPPDPTAEVAENPTTEEAEAIEEEVEVEATPTELPTEVPTETPTAVPSETPTPLPTETPTATPTPTTALIITLVDNSSVGIAEADVSLQGEEETIIRKTDEDGVTIFETIVVGSYEVEIMAEGFAVYTQTVDIQTGENMVDITLEDVVLATVNAETAYLRSGPSTAYPIVETVVTDDVLDVIAQSEDGLWLVVQTAVGAEGWINTEIVDVTGNVASTSTMPAPPVPTPLPTAIPATPTPAAGAFSPQQFYNDLVIAKANMDGINGMLGVGGGSCSEFMGYYTGLLYSPTYNNDIPPAWHTAYNEYRASVMVVLEYNFQLAEICAEGGGTMNRQTSGNAITAIAEALNTMTNLISGVSDWLAQNG